MSTGQEKSIVELLAEQRKESAEFSKANFGIQVGPDYPDMARDLLASDVFVQHLAADFLLLLLSVDEVLKTIKPGHSSIRTCPAVYTQPLQYLYWGIQIGRLQERQVAEALQSIAQGNEETR
jgi:hypothetical protein